MYFEGRKANYEKHPHLLISDSTQGVWQGYDSIEKEIKEKLVDKKKAVLVIDYYHGVNQNEIESFIQRFSAKKVIFCEEAKLDEKILYEKLKYNITDDRVFGVLGTQVMEDFYDCEKVKELQNEVNSIEEGLVIVYGVGAALITKGDILIYGDLNRWEIQLRYRSKELDNWGVGNFKEDILRKYKRGYFVEWRMLDRHKLSLFDDMDYFLDTNQKNNPKMITKKRFNEAIKKFSKQPFRLVPYFDEGIWGGRWMEEVCDLKREGNNYAWCFDGVPEENSICAKFGDVEVDMPAMNLVKREPAALLGKKVYSRFGAEFPIRFDFLDTMDGGNLSLQVHPLTEYIQQNFGMHYTQDESYYILDAGDDACVYLGVKDGVTEDELIPALQRAQSGEGIFDDTKYINKLPIQKHDHVLIPAGTIHCSGNNAMVLEISATPYIFTMKLWDWGRVGLDGKPRPINVDRGAASIQYDRTTDWVKENLIHNVQVLEENENVKIERTGLHELEFIETQRYWFSDTIHMTCDESVNVLNLIEGEEAVITSVDGSFEPFTVHYAETFIVPEGVKQYDITPSGLSKNKKIAVIRASVRV